MTLWDDDLPPATHLATRPTDDTLLEPALHWNLGRLRKWVRTKRDEGVECPACGQFAKVYRRSITGASAAALIALHRACGREYGHMPTILNRKQADETKMVYWGLIEAQPGERDDGSRRNGWWRVTELGIDFIHENLKVERHALVYDSKCIALEGEMVGIRDCLGEKFDYTQLMAGEA